MSLPQDAEIALTLLQITGLVLPVVVIALQPFYRGVAEGALEYREQNIRTDGGDDQVDILKQDSAPPVVQVGLLTMGVIILAALFSILALANIVVESTLLKAALAALILSFVSIFYLLWSIRMEFVDEIRVV